VFLSADVDRRVNDCLILVFRPIRIMVLTLLSGSLSPVSGPVNQLNLSTRAIKTMRRMPMWITPVWPYHSVLSKDQTFPALLEKIE